VILLATTVASAVLLTSGDFAHYWASLKSALYFWSNRYFAGFGEYFAPHSTELPLLHLWSISVEMQFYLLLPLLLFVVPRTHLATALCISFVATTGLLAVANGGPQRPSAAYFAHRAHPRIPDWMRSGGGTDRRTLESGASPVGGINRRTRRRRRFLLLSEKLPGSLNCHLYRVSVLP
jgi:peptidoglycan/LPS O-acetylase OafA/YrhL